VSKHLDKGENSESALQASNKNGNHINDVLSNIANRDQPYSFDNHGEYVFQNCAICYIHYFAYNF
jgi:hypothetical protein